MILPWGRFVAPGTCPVAKRIRADEARSGRARTPIIALTANAMAHQTVEYLAVGMDGFVAKPIDAAKLFQAIAEAIEAGDQQAERVAAC